MSNTFGTLFKVTTFGESHGPAIGAVVDGCPARLPLTEADIQSQLDRRRPGQSSLTTARTESDRVRILSGVENGLTLGSPLALLIESHDARAGDYRPLRTVPRPSQADFTYRAKYGITAASGGGRASARETAARVAAGAVAEKYLLASFGVTITAWVSAVGEITAPDLTEANVTRAQVDQFTVRCPDAQSAQSMAVLIEQTRNEEDSIGGVVTCVCQNVPAGWGEPLFDKLDALLGHALFSIPAVRGVEIGSGFSGARSRASLQNDLFVQKAGRLGTQTNRSGGIQGGISNGEPLVTRVAFKPTATIAREQLTADYEGRQQPLRVAGRHDPCVLPRAVPVVESMVALVLADAARRQSAPFPA